MNLSKEISKNKRGISDSVRNVNFILKNDSGLKARFNALMMKRLKPLTPTGLGAADDEPAWYESTFATDLFSLGKDAIKSNIISKGDEKRLNLEIKKIETQSAALDRQITLQSRLNSMGANAQRFGSSYLSTLTSSPIALAGLAGLGGLLIFFKMKKK